MSILLYRDANGRDVEIRNPTQEDWAACCRVVCERNADAIRREFLDGMNGSVLLTLAVGQTVGTTK